MAISEEDIEAANRRAVQTKAKHAVATKVRYGARRKRIVLHLDSGVELAFAPHLAQGLEGASAADLAECADQSLGFGFAFPGTGRRPVPARALGRPIRLPPLDRCAKRTRWRQGLKRG